jgi:hypothetical protein
VRADYAAADFARAVERVNAEPRPAELTAAVGVDWDYVAWVALGFAEDVLGRNLPDRERLVANGAEAFAAGFLIGLHLPERGSEPIDLGHSVGAAVESVRERGRHAVIADSCDLAAVADFETLYAESLTESIDVDVRDRMELRDPFTRLFESGLATGLVLASFAP